MQYDKNCSQSKQEPEKYLVARLLAISQTFSTLDGFIVRVSVWLVNKMSECDSELSTEPVDQDTSSEKRKEGNQLDE
jgi:hypothetical protein